MSKKKFVTRKNSRGAIEVELNEAPNEWNFRHNAFKLADEAHDYQLTVHMQNLMNTYGSAFVMRYIVEFHSAEIKRTIAAKNSSTIPKTLGAFVMPTTKKRQAK